LSGSDHLKRFYDQLLKLCPQALLVDPGIISKSLCDDHPVIGVSTGKLVRNGGEDAERIITVIEPGEKEGSAKL
jgi:hypothetical protein